MPPGHQSGHFAPSDDPAASYGGAATAGGAIAYEFVVAMQAGDGRGAVPQLFGDRFDAFWALRPSQEDVAGIFEHLGELYPPETDDTE